MLGGIIEQLVHVPRAASITYFANTVSDGQPCVRIINESFVSRLLCACTMFVCIPTFVYMYIHAFILYVFSCSLYMYVCLSVCLSVSGACACADIIHLLCYIYILADTWSHIYLHNVEFDGSTGLSGSRLFGHAGCGEVNNTSWHQDWIRQVCGIIVNGRF